MIRKNRLDYRIPGYTGFVPKNIVQKTEKPKITKKQGHIPNYSGYVPKIVPENHYGKTFG